MGRTVLHYVVGQTDENSEAIVKCLTDANADEGVKDVTGNDVTTYRANPMDLIKAKEDYTKRLDRQTAMVCY